MKIRVPWRVKRALRWIWSTNTVLVFRIGVHKEIAAVPEEPPAGIVFGSTPVHDMRIAPVELPAPLRRILDDFGPPAIAHLALIGDAIASWGVSVEAARWPITETGTWVNLPERAVCLMAFETQPLYRGKGIYTTLLREILRERFADGVRWAYIWCEERNHASRAAIERVGFQLVGCHSRTRLLGLSRRSLGGPR